eukprot:2807494-Amphidinium_carterae.1
MVRCGEKVQEAQDSVPGFSSTKGDVEKLTVYMTELLVWKECLRPPLYARLEKLVCDKLDELAKATSEKEDDPDVTHAMIKCLSEACIMWPLSADLMEAKETLATSLGKANIVQQLTALLGHCKVIHTHVSPDGGGRSEVSTALNALAKMDVVSAFPLELLKASTLEELKQAELDIMKHFIQSITTTDLRKNLDVSIFTSSFQVLAYAKKQSLDDSVAVIEDAASLVQQSIKREKCAEAELETCVFAERQAILKLKQSLTVGKSDIVVGVKPALQEVAAQHEKGLK